MQRSPWDGSYARLNNISSSDALKNIFSVISMQQWQRKCGNIVDDELWLQILLVLIIHSSHLRAPSRRTCHENVNYGKNIFTD